MDTQREMNGADSEKHYRAVIIDEAAAGSVTYPSLADYDILLSGDVLSACEDIFDKHGDTVIFLLLILPLHAMDAVSRAVNGKKSEAVYVSYVAMGTSESRSLADSALFALRETAITKSDFHFLAAKVFTLLLGEHRRNIEEADHTVRLIDAWNDQESLIHIGKALSLEKNPDKLLRTILYFSKKITGADAGSIFIVEKKDGVKRLRFKYSHTFSKDLSYEEFTMPLDTNSIAGYVAVTGQVLNIPDAYELDDSSPVAFNPSFDKAHGYRTKSMLVLPMRNHLDEVIGVIQLINSKESTDSYTGNEAFEIRLAEPEDFNRNVKPFHERYENLMEAVAGQAAIAMENNRMLLQIERQFEEFVKASVTAIESRDPATSGHSFRVAAMCVKTAELVNSSGNPAFGDQKFSDTKLKELEFAALLHDFGKVYIDPAIFVKAKKLFPKDFEYLMMRLNFLYRSLELCYIRNVTPPLELSALFDEKLKKIEAVMKKVTVLNEPVIKPDDMDRDIDDILSLKQELQCEDLGGSTIPILEDSEITNLRIKRGTLNAEERKIIESHVVHTYNFVSKIPWPEEYRNIPEIALGHHEKMDGTGYPNRIKGVENISLQSRIMAIVDIFDALSAADRPYKKAVPKEKIFDILREEAATGKLDGDIVELFITGRAWELNTSAPL